MLHQFYDYHLYVVVIRWHTHILPSPLHLFVYSTPPVNVQVNYNADLNHSNGNGLRTHHLSGYCGDVYYNMLPIHLALVLRTSL
jgi:hypothetical protein